MARRNYSYQQLFLDSLGQVGETAMKAGKSIGDARRADAENTRQDAESKARLGLIGEQTRGAKVGADKANLDYERLMKEEALRKSLGESVAAQSEAQEGVPTATGRAVDFQAVKKANKDTRRADMALWNFINPGSPLGADQLAEKRARDVAGDELAASEKEADATRKQEKHDSDLATADATRLSGRFSPVALEGGGIGKFNTKTGEVEDTGAKGAPKTGGKTGVVKAGETLVPGLKAMADVEITKDSVQKVKQSYATFTELKNQLAEYQNLYKKLGTEVVGEGADQLEAMATGMQLTLKELQNLGVLNGPDLMLMQKQIPNAAGLKAKAKGLAYGTVGADPIGPQLQELGKFIDNRFTTHARANGFELESAAPAPGAGGAAPGGLDQNDPKVKAALAAGYSEDEIRAYLGKGKP